VELRYHFIEANSTNTVKLCAFSILASKFILVTGYKKLEIILWQWHSFGVTEKHKKLLRV
jgi:hypothetical protein